MWCIHIHSQTHTYLPHCIMDLKRKSQAGPMPCTIKTRWSTFSGSPGNTQKCNVPEVSVVSYTFWNWLTVYSNSLSKSTHIPSGISTEMLSTPLLTVWGRVCSEGEDTHSSCNPIGWYCIISWVRSKEMEKNLWVKNNQPNKINNNNY